MFAVVLPCRLFRLGLLLRSLLIRLNRLTSMISLGTEFLCVKYALLYELLLIVINSLIISVYLFFMASLIMNKISGSICWMPYLCMAFFSLSSRMRLFRNMLCKVFCLSKSLAACTRF